MTLKSDMEFRLSDSRCTVPHATYTYSNPLSAMGIDYPRFSKYFSPICHGS
jgi:hypothetical protein